MNTADTQKPRLPSSFLNDVLYEVARKIRLNRLGLRDGSLRGELKNSNYTNRPVAYVSSLAYRMGLLTFRTQSVASCDEMCLAQRVIRDAPAWCGLEDSAAPGRPDGSPSAELVAVSRVGVPRSEGWLPGDFVTLPFPQWHDEG